MRDFLEPSMPGRFDLGRLNVPEHLAYLRECRWCHDELRVRGAVVYCPSCDKLHNLTNGSEGWQR